MAVTSERGQLTTMLVILFALVLMRWLELRLGWPEYVSLPTATLAAVGVLEATAPAGTRRLSVREWTLKALLAVAVGALIYMLAR